MCVKTAINMQFKQLIMQLKKLIAWQLYFPTRQCKSSVLSELQKHTAKIDLMLQTSTKSSV